MKATTLLCFALLSCVSLLAEAKSIKSKHETELTESERKGSSKHSQNEDERKEADANKCTCEMPGEEQQKITRKCDCSQEDMKKCQNENEKCDLDSTSKAKKAPKPEDCNCKNTQDTGTCSGQRNTTKRCNCKCSSHSNTGHSAVAQVSDNPGILAVAPLMPQADGSQMVRKGKGSKKCCCCDCCHDCCCHCCEPCCCCCHCCEPCCCCCCHECCCPCCCHCCHCCPCCHCCCCKKSKSSERVPGVVNPQIAAAHSQPQHH